MPVQIIRQRMVFINGSGYVYKWFWTQTHPFYICRDFKRYVYKPQCVQLFVIQLTFYPNYLQFWSMTVQLQDTRLLT